MSSSTSYGICFLISCIYYLTQSPCYFYMYITFLDLKCKCEKVWDFFSFFLNFLKLSDAYYVTEYEYYMGLFARMVPYFLRPWRFALSYAWHGYQYSRISTILTVKKFKIKIYYMKASTIFVTYQPVRLNNFHQDKRNHVSEFRLRTLNSSWMIIHDPKQRNITQKWRGQTPQNG